MSGNERYFWNILLIASPAIVYLAGGSRSPPAFGIKDDAFQIAANVKW